MFGRTRPAANDELFDQAKRLFDHYNRNIGITFGAQLLFSGPSLEQRLLSSPQSLNLPKMLIMDYYSVCTALLLFLRVATAERPFSKLKLIKTYLRRRRG